MRIKCSLFYVLTFRLKAAIQRYEHNNSICFILHYIEENIYLVRKDDKSKMTLAGILYHILFKSRSIKSVMFVNQNTLFSAF